MVNYIYMEENSQQKNPMSQVYGSPQENRPAAPSPVQNTGDNNNGNKKRSWPFAWLLFVWEFVKIIIIAIIIVLPIRYFLFQPFIVKGDSMVPNFQSGNYLIVDEISYRFSNPQRGDVIVLKYPLDTTQRFIKRIIGLPGETVQVQNGKITILKDGKDITLNEKNYLPNLLSTDGNVNVTLGANQYFVLGDNRQFSYDSRRWGILPREDIVGKAVLRILPVARLGYISAPSY